MDSTREVKRFLLVCCDIFLREACWAIYNAPHTIDVKFIPKGLHVRPEEMRYKVQEKIDASRGQGYDAILLGFGLCGNVAQGLMAGDIPLVIPKVHDCIGIFYGSNAKYLEAFSSHPGTYYYTVGSFERRTLDDSEYSALGADLLDDPEDKLKEYQAKYGLENARYLVEMARSWQTRYTRVVYFEVPDFKFLGYAERAKAIAKDKNMEFLLQRADLSLMERLLSGQWGQDFLVVAPGMRIQATYDNEIMVEVTNKIP